MEKLSKTEIVKKYVLEQAVSGRLIHGQRLGSCRKTAELLGVNKITVDRAYEQLEQEHRVYSVPRGGFYWIDSEEPKPRSFPADFSVIKPDERLIPYREFTHVMNRAVDLYKNKVFDYEFVAGLPSFQSTLKTLFEEDGVYTSPDCILVTNGAQQAISLALRSIFEGQSGRLLVEEPTYGLAIRMAESTGIPFTGIKRGIQGYDLRELERIFKNENIRAFYLIPRFQNPTGYSLTAKEKQKVAELCSRYNVLILEDDFLADLGSGSGEMTVDYYDTDDRTFYIRSFSKTFMPGIRLGALVVPKRFFDRAVLYKRLDDLNTSSLPQAALELFLKAGMYKKHIQKIKKSYRNKMKRARDILESVCPQEISWYVPENGFFLSLEFARPIDPIRFKADLDRQGILIRTAQENFLKPMDGEGEKHFLSLCIANVPQEKINALADIISAVKIQL
jgi:DNA-binding transcriptional MocR family regulator